MPIPPPNPYFNASRGETRAQRYARERMTLHLYGISRDDQLCYTIRDLVPEAWATIEADIPVFEPKVKMTLRVDESIAKFYRGMGKGYQGRINRILGTYAQMRISEVEAFEKRVAARGATLDMDGPIGGS